MAASLTREQVRAVDQRAIETLGLPGLVLMENAGRQGADVVCALLRKKNIPRGPRCAARVAIVAGAGNNGGDGFVIARHLSLRGVAVAAYLVSPAEAISGDARVNLDAWRALGGEIHEAATLTEEQRAAHFCEADLIVDAVGGTGITGPLRPALARAVEQINQAAAAGVAVVAVDCPTGLNCDTGTPAGVCVRADVTVTFVARKVGFDVPASEAYTGNVIVADIGIPAEF